LCGCGQKTTLARSTNPALGWVKGQPIRFIKGHARRRNIVNGLKICSLCGKSKPLVEFHKSEWNLDGYDHRCRSCNLLRRLHKTIASHGLTWDDHQAMLAQQHFACLICLRSQDEVSLGIDHDHVTGKVRGLLCRACNSALGQFRDDAVVLRRAADYVDGVLARL